MGGVVGCGVSCRGGVGGVGCHAGVGGVCHAGVGWVIQEWGGVCHAGVGWDGWGVSCRGRVGWGVSYRGGMGHTLVGWGMSCRGGVGHTGGGMIHTETWIFFIVYQKGDLVKQPMKSMDVLPKNVPGVGWGR